jgi:hypothetical protein
MKKATKQLCDSIGNHVPDSPKRNLNFAVKIKLQGIFEIVEQVVLA